MKLRKRLICADCREAMADMAADSVDSIICDPPYGLKFMGKGWDHGVPGIEFWREALRVVKPGAYLLAFGGTRTHHRLMVAIEDAGWEIRDCIMWVYGAGFPKSLNIRKAIDKAAGAQRIIIGQARRPVLPKGRGHGRQLDGRPIEIGILGASESHIINLTAPATAAAKQWDGWGTALKPAWEPIIIARKPLIGTVIENVQQYGTGGLNIDGCRVGTEIITQLQNSGGRKFARKYDTTGENLPVDGVSTTTEGRWPANLIHDGSEEVVSLFPQSKDGVAVLRNGGGNKPGGDRRTTSAYKGTGLVPDKGFGGEGSAARFFYCAKASKADRGKSNNHPTVKPTTLMQYLCRLITPPNGTVLDPFMGSGSTGKAALLEGFTFIGIDISPEYVEIARSRV